VSERAEARAGGESCRAEAAIPMSSGDGAAFLAEHLRAPRNRPPRNEHGRQLNLQGVGRDLTFHPLNGMIGSPTVLVTGLELRKGE